MFAQTCFKFEIKSHYNGFKLCRNFGGMPVAALNPLLPLFSLFELGVKHCSRKDNSAKELLPCVDTGYIKQYSVFRDLILVILNNTQISRFGPGFSCGAGLPPSAFAGWKITAVFVCMLVCVTRV